MPIHSETLEHLRSGQLVSMDYAIIEATATTEATAITEDGGIVPTTPVGNSSFAILASKVIIEPTSTRRQNWKGYTTSKSRRGGRREN